MYNYYKKENDKVRESYNQSVETISGIYNKLQENKENLNKYDLLFLNISSLILKNVNFIKKLEENENYFAETKFEQLKEENASFHEEVLPENYNTSYANPTYCVEIFGDEFGALFSKFYTIFRYYKNYSFENRTYMIEKYNQVFISVYNYVTKEELSFEKLNKLVNIVETSDQIETKRNTLKKEYDKANDFYLDIFMNSDIDNLNYLFKYGGYITENEIKIAKFFSKYPIEKIQKIARIQVDAYLRSFKIEKKDISIKSTVSFLFPIGFEKLAYWVTKYFEENGLDVIIPWVISPQPNKQFGYDHRFDNSLYFDEDFTKNSQKAFRMAFENNKKIVRDHSGVVFIEKFGEKPFAPENKKECLKFTTEQSVLYRKHNNAMSMISEDYSPREETSFSIMAFPSPEIGDNFDEIFEDTLEINSLETSKYEVIQNQIINVLDKADFVHIKGKGASKTDFKVKMQNIKDPLTETNFCNCGADVNIPVGEVFTSPQLKGTTGLLHIEDVFLNGLQYKDLHLHFIDGFVEKYSCSNFETEEANKNYIFENLFSQNKTLPLGEFAIGTNTLAYKVARKHNILNILPILIVEKMGPHFAIGDTCYSRSEDLPAFNMYDNKEITAKDNEKSILRKTDIDQAYTNCHTDITLPYESIDFITAVSKDGEKFDIIRDGRFVVKGTEELNVYLEGII